MSVFGASGSGLLPLFNESLLGTTTKPGGNMMFSTNTPKLVMTLVILGCSAGAIFAPVGTAQAAAPGYKVNMIKSSAESAREAVQNGGAFYHVHR